MRAAAGLALQAALTSARMPGLALGQAPQRPGRAPFCLFSKHLPELDWSDVGPCSQGRRVRRRRSDRQTGRPRAAGASRRRSASCDRRHPGARRDGPDDHDRPDLGDIARSRGRCSRPRRRSGVGYFKTGYWRYTHVTGRARAGRRSRRRARGAGRAGARLRDRDGIPQPRGLHRRRVVGHRAGDRPARSAVGRLLLRPAARRGRGRRRARGRPRCIWSRRG